MDILNALVVFLNFVFIPAAAYGAQLALGALGVTLIYGILRFSNFAHGDTMAFGTAIVILLTWGLQALGVSIYPLPTALLAVALVCSLLLNASSESERLILFTYLADASRETPAILSILYNSLAPSMREILINSQLGPIVDAVQTIAQAAIFEPVFAAQATETARRGGPDAFLEEAGFSCLLKCGSFGGPLTDARRLVLAKLSTALLASLLDAAAV